jgi:hypothetical protein
MDEDGGFLLGNMKSALEVTRLDDLTTDWIIFKCSTVGKFFVSIPPSSASVINMNTSYFLSDVLAYQHLYSYSAKTGKCF